MAKVYEDENEIKTFDDLVKAFFPFKNEQEIFNVSISKEMLSLLDSYPFECFYEYFDINLLKNRVNEENKNKDEVDDLFSIYDWIKKTGNLGKYSVPSFIVSPKRKINGCDRKFNQYQSLILHISFSLSMLGNYHSRIITILNLLRYISSGIRPGFLEGLSDIESLEIDKIIDRLNSSDISDKFSKDLHSIIISLEDILSKSSGIKRNNEETKLINQCIFEDDEATVYEAIEVNSSRSNDAIYYEEENISAIKNKHTVVRIKKPYNKSRYVGKYQSNAITNYLKRRKLYLSSDVKNMTDYEAKIILENIYDNIDKRVAKKLLMIILTGSGFKDLDKIISKKNDKNRLIGFKRKLSLPSHNQDERIVGILSDVANNYWLPLPKVLVKGISSLRFSDVEDEELKEFIKSINKKYGITLSVQSISNFFEQTMRKHGVDHVFTSYIKGGAKEHYPAIYYMHVKYMSLFGAYRDYLNVLCDLTENIDFKDVTEYPDVINLGSPVYFDVKVIRFLLGKLKRRFYANKKRGGQQYHNDIVLYVQLVLAMSTGYRPVGGWFGTKKHLHLRTSCYWISDKQDSVNDNSRFIILPTVTVCLLESYFEYIQSKVVELKNSNLTLKNKYEKVLNGEGDLFFYLSDNNEVVDVIPSQYKKFIQPYFPLQENWFRHYIRSYLSGNKVGPELVDAWMGHSSLEALAYQSSSSLCRKDMGAVAKIINQLLIDSGVDGQL